MQILAGVLLSACLPVPETLDPGLQPVYLGSAPSAAGQACQSDRREIRISGPRRESLSVSTRMESDGRALLGLRAEAPDGSGLALSAPSISLSEHGLGATSKPVRIAALSREMTRKPGSPTETWKAEFALGKIPPSGYRVTLPAVVTDGKDWRPGAVELRPVGPSVGFPSLTC